MIDPSIFSVKCDIMDPAKESEGLEPMKLTDSNL